MARGPYLPNLEPYIAAGLNPITGLPFRFDSANKSMLKEEIKRQLSILDEQDAVNRFTWYNLPKGLNSQLIERVLYYKGQGALFYKEALDQFFFLPYALNGTIDVYGRYTGICALPFAGGKSDKDGSQIPLFDETYYPLYDVNENDDEAYKYSAVICKDYTPSLSETIIPRSQIQECVIDCMSEVFPFARTNLLSHSGISAIRVNNEDEESNVNAAAAAITEAALSGKPYIPVIGTTEFQDMTQGSPLKSEEFLIVMQAMDNYRLSLYGLETGGLFQKKSHMLEAEQDMNSGHAKLAMKDSLENRQRFCDIVNSVWDLGMYVDISPEAKDTPDSMYIKDNEENSNDMEQ